MKGKPAEAGSEPALAGFPSIARGFIPVRISVAFTVLVISPT
jgi:hypothetical protein